ncbi:MAG TPA: TonB-dependent receptor, partial [Candidatus Eremiobacteraceae bacterium]|nr:TonB-dependent receptor [Candidatus Eremiobacteraceae bacterium]
RHAIGSRGALTYGVGYKRSHIRDFGDPGNDWIYGQAVNVAAGGLPTDCANAFTIQNYNSFTCAYTLFSNRTASDYIFNVDHALASGNHTIRWGALYDVTNVAKLYNVTLQPSNFLSPLFASATPNAAYPVIDNAPNNVDTESAYLQDSWRMGNAWELDYGLRSDSFQLRSNEFANDYTMFSPRVKLTSILGPRSSVYVFYGRFFTPFSFENVSPSAAFTLNLPIQPTIAQFDLKPQRDSVYEVGGHLPVGSGDLGLRVMQKNATDLIDDTQVGLTQLHQDINYQIGRIATQTAVLQMPFGSGNSYYVSVNHTYSENKGCETQLLAPCFGSPTDFTPADHEQRWGSNAGVLLNNSRGGWFSMNGEYGSGLSSAGCPPGTSGYCKYTPHTVFNVEEGIALGQQTKLVARVENLLNDHFYITYLNAQGNHWYTQRAYSIGLQFGPHG